LHNKVAIVTGASRGIGRGVALALAKEGAHIVCAARSTNEAPSKLPGTIEETARQVEALGQRALAVACDVSDEAQVAAMVERAAREFGRIDLLVNNAAVNTRAPIVDTPPKLWDLVMRVNLRGTFLCSRAVLPHMIERDGGSIVNVSSGAAVMPALAAELGVIPYAVSKAAVESFTESLAEELRSHNIAVTCLRIETAVATEGARMVSEDTEMPSGWVATEVAANALLWLATRGLEDSGRTVTIAETQRA
jgi:NAD(P)-dependent dehydrogenase (short-subunit alcohol dehydrogenase family)